MKWTNEQTQWLIENYSNEGTQESCKFLGVTQQQLQSKITTLARHKIFLSYKPYNEHSKKCLTCKEWKKLNCFFNSPRGRSGKCSYCKDCYNSQEKNRYAKDKKFRILRLIRSRFHKMFDKKQFSINAETILGCTTAEIIKHIEQQFDSNISWNNKHLWDIDHILPVSILQNNPEKLYLIFNYRNHQPLLKLENGLKSDNLHIAKQHLLEKIEKFGIDSTYQEMLDLLENLIQAPCKL